MTRRAAPSGRRVLVTGGFGFIGSHLVERLLTDRDATVHVVDDLSSSVIDVDAFLRSGGRPDRLSFDVCSVADYYSRVGRPEFHEIYHLASVVGPVAVLQHAGKIAGAIVNDTLRVIDLARRAEARLIYVSTSEVYGGGRDGYCSERDFTVIQPKATIRLEYAVAKLAAEVALINSTTVTPFPGMVVRPFNVAGPRQSSDAGFVLPRFIKQILKDEPLTVYGDGSMIRAFAHVVDIAAGLTAVAEHGRAGEVYNLGNPANKTSILELAERVIHLTRSRSGVQFVDPKTLFGPLFEEANDKYPDIDKAQRELDWRPKYDLDQIVLDAWSYIASGRRD